MVGGWHSRIESLQVLSTLDLDLDCDNFLEKFYFVLLERRLGKNNFRLG